MYIYADDAIFYLMTTQVDAIDYYRGQLAMYQELCEAEKVNAFHDPLGIVFVTFSTYLMAQR